MENWFHLKKCNLIIVARGKRVKGREIRLNCVHLSKRQKAQSSESAREWRDKNRRQNTQENPIKFSQRNRLGKFSSNVKNNVKCRKQTGKKHEMKITQNYAEGKWEDFRTFNVRWGKKRKICEFIITTKWMNEKNIRLHLNFMTMFLRGKILTLFSVVVEGRMDGKL